MAYSFIFLNSENYTVLEQFENNTNKNITDIISVPICLKKISSLITNILIQFYQSKPFKLTAVKFVKDGHLERTA